MTMPLYKIDRTARVIRVFHGDLDKSRWKRGSSTGARDCRAVESAILQATGMRRVYRRHERVWVVFRLSARTFDVAAIAVRFQIGKPVDED